MVLSSACRLRDRCALASGLAAMTTQAGWSFGFFFELLSKLRLLLGQPETSRKPKEQRQVPQ